MPYDAAIPEMWHAALEEAYRNKHVYAGLCNRNYEGEIRKQGDVVRILTMSDPTRRTYTKNTTITAPEVLSIADQTLVIDQAFYWNVEIDDVDKIQVKTALRDGIINGIAFSLAEGLDDNIAALMLADGAGFSTAGSTIGNRLVNTTIVTTDRNAYTLLVDLQVRLDERNVPSEGRWVALPPWFKGSMQKDARFVEYGTPGNMATLKSGRIATAAGFEVYVSNNVPSTATTLAFVIAGHRDAVTLAEQIPGDGLEFYRPDNRFSDAMKVLHLFGRTVVQPFALAGVLAENG